MLNRMRKGVKSLTAKVLIGLLVISFAVWGIGDIFSFRLDSAVARVGGVEVSAERFANALARQQSRLSRQMGQLVTFEQMREAGVARSVLDGLIRDAAFEEEMNRLGLSAPDSAVAESISQNPGFQGPAGQFSTEFYRLALQQQGLTATEFEALTRTLLGQEILVETVEAGAVPPPGAGERIAIYRGEVRGVNVLTLSADMAPDPGEPDAGALRTYHEENSEQFREPERRWGHYLHIDAERLMAELTPDEDALRAAYDERKDLFTTPESRAVDQITYDSGAAADQAVAQLASGDATFESLAETQGLAPGDTDLGSITRGDLPGAAAALVFDTEEAGVVGPVELPAGYAVYRVREVSEGGTQPFEAVRDRIAEELARDRLLSRAPEIANRVEELRAAGRSFEEIADETAAVHGRFEGLAQNGMLADGGEAEGLIARPAFIEEAFEALDAEERDLVETGADGYFLVMVERIAPSAVPPLDEVRAEAIAAWQADQRRQALEEMAEGIVDRLGTEASVWDIGTELSVAVRPFPPFTRLNPPPALPRPLIEKVFRTKSGEGAYAAAPGAPRVVVAQVSSITLPAREQIERESAEIETALADSLRGDLGEYFARAVVARHEPTVDWTVVDEVFRQLGGGGGQPQLPSM